MTCPHLVIRKLSLVAILLLTGCAKKEPALWDNAKEMACKVDECVISDTSHPEKGFRCGPCPDFTADVSHCQIEVTRRIQQLVVEENQALVNLHDIRVSKVVEEYLDKFQEQAQKGQHCTEAK